VGGVELHEGEYDFAMVAATDGAAATLGGSAGVVVLDTAVTPDLEAEGVARDLVRLVQQARRAAGLAVSDRISLHVVADAATVAAFETHRQLVTGETLAVAATTEVAEVDEPRIEVTRTDGPSR
jgi:isoleucyl-tRNA synthetase